MALIAAELTECEKKQSEYEEQALEMLEEKYGEKFAVWQYSGQEFFEGYFTVICYPENMPAILFETRAACDNSYIEDGYIAARVCDKAEKQIDENLKHIGGYLLEKVVPVSRSIESNDSDMSIEEFMSLKSKNRFAVYLMYCPQVKNACETYQEIQKVFRGLESMSGNIQLYVMQEEELKRMQEYLMEMIEPDHEFDKMTEDMMRITIPFEKGMIQMSEDEFLKKAGGIL